MSSFELDIPTRASVYAERRNMFVERRLGFGKDGSVYQSSLSTAIKVFARRDAYVRELACYQRFAAHDIEEIRGHVVPRLLDAADDLGVLEMEIVSAPYLLDFADAWLDIAPDFTAEVMEEWETEKREQFGSRWAEVQLVLAELRGHYGVHLLDVNPGNITFGEGEAD